MAVKTVPVSFRLPEWMVQVIDQAIAYHSEHNGKKYNRTQAISRIVTRGARPIIDLVVLDNLKKVHDKMELFYSAWESDNKNEAYSIIEDVKSIGEVINSITEHLKNYDDNPNDILEIVEKTQTLINAAMIIHFKHTNKN